MALMDFIKKQFIDVIQWTEEDSDGILAIALPDAGLSKFSTGRS
jgi:membrane protease subunit (stomatin/prohibitin family)